METEVEFHGSTESILEISGKLNGNRCLLRRAMSEALFDRVSVLIESCELWTVRGEIYRITAEAYQHECCFDYVLSLADIVRVNQKHLSDRRTSI